MCFSLLWFFQLIIWIAGICFLVALAKIWLPDLLAWFGVIGGKLVATIRLIIGFIIFCVIVWLVYDVIVCSGFMFPRMR